MDHGDAAIRELQDEWQQLNTVWQQTNGVWQDTVQQQFVGTHWDGLVGGISHYQNALVDMAQTLADAWQNVD